MIMSYHIFLKWAQCHVYSATCHIGAVIHSTNYIMGFHYISDYYICRPLLGSWITTPAAPSEDGEPSTESLGLPVWPSWSSLATWGNTNVTRLFVAFLLPHLHSGSASGLISWYRLVEFLKSGSSSTQAVLCHLVYPVSTCLLHTYTHQYTQCTNLHNSLLILTKTIHKGHSPPFLGWNVSSRHVIQFRSL